MSRQRLPFLGKYRDLVLAIALFLFLDLGVLGFNFYTSRLIEDDAGRINLAGELRMYSQQLAKSVLTMQYELNNGQPTQTSQAQISEADAGFRASLRRLEDGLRQAEGGWAGAANARALEQLVALTRTWSPLDREVQPLLKAQSIQPADIVPAANEVFARNVRIMQQAGDLTDTLEAAATQRAQTMRQIQVVAIALALLNFVFIVFKFVRRLRQSDRLTDEARRDTTRILETVQEGLFLLDREGRIGGQQSASLAALVGTALPAGTDFLEVLHHRIDAEHHQSARDFIDLLFNRKIKSSLLKQLNPLRQIAFAREDGRECHLDFEFEQVRGADQVEFLLVSVADVTQKVSLARELAHAEQRAKTEVDALLAVLEQDPRLVENFLRTTETRLAQINRDLAEVQPHSGAYLQLVNKLARTAHGIKGEAAALGLRTVEKDLHAFEETLVPLRGRRDLGGEDLIPVAVALNEVHEAITKIAGIIARVRRYGSERPEPEAAGRNELQALLEQIEHMTLRIAQDLNKKARLHVVAPPEVRLPEGTLAFLRSALPQLVRNAVAHGIEPAAERQKKGKPDEGRITCTIDIDAAGKLLVAVHDDGCGLSPAQLRATFSARGLMSAEEAARLSDQEVIAKIFEPGFSALDHAHAHAGRGEGLSVVRAALRDIGGRLRVASQPEVYTRFAMHLEKECWQCA